VGPWDTESTATPTAIQASPTDEGWRLHGTAAHVVDGHRADQFVVLAGTASGIGAFVVPAEAVRVTRSPSLDPALPLSQIHFDDVIINESRRLRGANAAEGVADAFDEALVGMAMTTVGACQRSLDLVIEYVSGREQFGAPVGSFQAVKHKIVDVHVAIERARALGYFAAAAIAEGDERRGMAAAMAKAAAGEAERITVRHAIQLFGGIGFTWENDLHLYLRRAQACSLLFGTAVEHRARIGRHVLAAARATMGD
jgi:alkylation response protein AidB-like acyl-CoA dehydrogenase